MAEAFAKRYGSDVLEPASAGFAPAGGIPELTVLVMDEKNISMDGHYPKGMDAHSGSSFDLVVNMSGYKLSSKVTTRVEYWNVRDPIGEEGAVYREVRDQIEGLVMRLILSARSEQRDRAPEVRRPRFLRN